MAPTPKPTRIVTRSVSIAPADTFVDLQDNALVVDYDKAAPSPFSDIRARIFSGYESAATIHWRGPGISSSTAAASSGRALGYAEASDVLGPNGGDFFGETVDASAVLVRYTLAGDANLDGGVNFNDLVALAQNYNTPSGATWSHGDFNFDGVVNFSDLVALAQNYNTSLPASPLPASFGQEFERALGQVPEPSGILFSLLAPLLAFGRRHRAQPSMRNFIAR
jgi:hypothetical protein